MNSAIVEVFPLENIAKYHDNDILCGRGKESYNNPGNSTFRELIKLNKELYTSLEVTKKIELSKTIVNAIRNQKPPGRFLAHDKTTNLWNDIGDKKAIEKTSQALREGQQKTKEKLAGNQVFYGIQVPDGFTGLPTQPQMGFNSPMTTETGLVSGAQMNRQFYPHTYPEVVNQHMQAQAQAQAQAGIIYPNMFAYPPQKISPQLGVFPNMPPPRVGAQENNLMLDQTTQVRNNSGNNQSSGTSTTISRSDEENDQMSVDTFPVPMQIIDKIPSDARMDNMRHFLTSSLSTFSKLPSEKAASSNQRFSDITNSLSLSTFNNDSFVSRLEGDIKNEMDQKMFSDSTLMDFSLEESPDSNKQLEAPTENSEIVKQGRGNSDKVKKKVSLLRVLRSLSLSSSWTKSSQTSASKSISQCSDISLIPSKELTSDDI